MTKQDVDIIWAANRKVTLLAAEWLTHVRAGRYASAAKARRMINKITREILEKYQIVL